MQKEPGNTGEQTAEARTGGDRLGKRGSKRHLKKASLPAHRCVSVQQRDRLGGEAARGINQTISELTRGIDPSSSGRDGKSASTGTLQRRTAGHGVKSRSPCKLDFVQKPVTINQ